MLITVHFPGCQEIVGRVERTAPSEEHIQPLAAR
jgi:hypothetical protein